MSPGWKGGLQRASLLSLGVAGLPTLGHRESQGLCWGGEAGQIVLRLFSAWVLGHACRTKQVSRHLGQSVSCAGQSALSCILPYEKVLGSGVGNTQRSIL